MQPTWEILHAMLHCPYKAWQLAKKTHQHPPVTIKTPIAVPATSLSATDKLVLTALYQGQSQVNQAIQQEVTITLGNQQTSTVRLRLGSKKAQQLFADAQHTIKQMFLLHFIIMLIARSASSVILVTGN